MALRGEFDIGRTAIDAEVSVIVHLKPSIAASVSLVCLCLFLLVTHHIFLIVAFLIVAF